MLKAAKLVTLLLAGSIGVSVCMAAEEKKVAVAETRTVSMTIFQGRHSLAANFSTNLEQAPALVFERRKIDLVAGENKINLLDIPSQLIPETVTFRSLTAPETTSVIEQVFTGDPVGSSEDILRRYIGREIIINRKQMPLKDERSHSFETIQGKLLTMNEKHFVLQTENKQLPIQVILRNDDISEIKLFKMDDAIFSQPVLNWKIEAERAGTHEILVGYQTKNIGWQADYSVILTDNDSIAELTGLLTIENFSGVSYPKAKLRFMKKGSDSEFQLERLVDIPVGSKQVQFMANTAVRGVTKKFILSGTCNKIQAELDKRSDERPDEFVAIPNPTKVALPGGKIHIGRLRKSDDDPQPLPESSVGSIAKDSPMMVRIGQQGDIDVKRKCIVNAGEAAAGPNNDACELRLRNRSAKPVSLIVREQIFTAPDWRVIRCSEKFQQVAVDQIEMTVEIPANGEKVITYTVGFNPVR